MGSWVAASSEGSDRMRGPDEQTSHMFSYVVPEQRVRQDHVGAW
jgi:hypothetical protein